MLSYYEILQVESNASDDEIKKSYRRLCKILHPDVHNNTRESNVIFALLQEAYETISDPKKRKKYNPVDFDHTDINFESDYLEIIEKYKKIVSDYTYIIEEKDKRERDLLDELEELRKQNDFNKNHSIDQKDNFIEKNNINELESDINDKGYTVLGIIIVLVIIILLILFSFFILSLSDGAIFFLFLFGLPFYFLYKTFN